MNQTIKKEKPDDFDWDDFFSFIKDEIPLNHAEYIECLLRSVKE